MNDNIIEKINNEIEYLTKLKTALENPEQKEYELTYYETPYYETVLKTIYKPSLMYYKNSEVCKKCNGTGIVHIGSDNDDHFKMCDCFYRKKKYFSKEITVRSVIDDGEDSMYLCFDGECVFRVRCSSVVEGFDEEDYLTTSGRCLYNEELFERLEDCEVCCDFLNRRLEDGK